MNNKKEVTRLDLICPFAVMKGKTKKKRVPINLNWYRNAHYMESNEVKRLYKELIAPQVEGIRLKTPVSCTVQIFKPTRRILDKHNVDSITRKFLFDALTELGVWEDDNDEFIKIEKTLPTIHDKGNERVEVTFKSVKE